MADATIPTPEQDAKAKYDLLLADLEKRIEEIRAMRIHDPLDIRLKTISIDERLADIDLNQEQLRQLKTYEWWKLMFAGMTAIAIAAGVIGGGLGWLLAHAAR